MSEAMKTGQPYQTRLDPPTGPAADAKGNFLPLPEWLPSEPRPTDWPPRIYAPREVYDRAKANSIDWRTLLDWKAYATAPETDAGRARDAKS